MEYFKCISHFLFSFMHILSRVLILKFYLALYLITGITIWKKFWNKTNYFKIDKGSYRKPKMLLIFRDHYFYSDILFWITTDLWKRERVSWYKCYEKMTCLYTKTFSIAASFDLKRLQIGNLSYRDFKL